MTLSHDLPHHAEVLLLDVVTAAVVARQLWCAEHCPVHGSRSTTNSAKPCVAKSTVWTVRCGSGSQARVTQMHAAISAPPPVLNEMKRHAMVEMAILLVTDVTPKGPWTK